MFYFFFFNDTATTEIYTLSLHDALPIWFVVRVLGLGDGGEWTAPGFILAETVGGLGIVPTFAAAWVMSRMERRPFGAYGLPSRGAFGRRFWAGWGWGLGGVAALAALIAALGGLRGAGWALSGAALARAAVLWAIAMTLIGLAEGFAFRGYPQLDRKSVVEGKSGDLGGRRIIKKKKNKEEKKKKEKKKRKNNKDQKKNIAIKEKA